MQGRSYAFGGDNQAGSGVGMSIHLPFSATRYRLTQLMHTFELKSKTLLRVPQGAYVRVLSKRQQQGLTALPVLAQKRFRVLIFAQVLQSADAIRPVGAVTNLTPSIQIP